MQEVSEGMTYGASGRERRDGGRETMESPSVMRARVSCPPRAGRDVRRGSSVAIKQLHYTGDNRRTQVTSVFTNPRTIPNRLKPQLLQ